MEVNYNVYIDLQGTDFERKMIRQLLRLVLKCCQEEHSEEEYDEEEIDDEEFDDMFEITENGNKISIDAMAGIFGCDIDPVDHGVIISNAFASILPKSHFAYYADVDYTSGGGGWDVVLVKYDGNNMLAFGPSRGMDIGNLYESYDDETGEESLVPGLENAIKAKIDAGEWVFPIESFRQMHESKMRGDYSSILEFLTETYPPMAIEYTEPAHSISPEWKNAVFEITNIYMRVICRKEIFPEDLLLQSMEMVLKDNDNIQGLTEYLEGLSEEIISNVINHCDGEQYPLSMKVLREEQNRRM